MSATTMDPGGGPSKRARRDEEASSGRAEEQTLSESQRMLWDAAQLRQRAAAVQREAEAVAAAAVSRREVAERRLQNARIQAAAAEQRAREDAQLVLQRAQASIDAAAAAAAMEPEGSPARTEAAAAAAAALASVHKKVDAHVAAIKARAEVAYGVKKAEAIIAAAAAEAAAALAGWPAEQRRLLERAERLELQAPLVAELEAQRSSALVQALATSGCLPLIASCLGDAADKLHFALSCKALLRQYRQDQAAWMRGLHVSLACSGSPKSVAACERRLQRLMQRVPHGSISSLSLVQPDRPYAANDMLGLLLSITEHLVQLELQLNDLSTFTAMPVLSWPLLRRAVLHSNGVTSRHSLHWSFGSAPLLESLSLGNGVLRQLPPTLTHLDLFDVFVLEPAVVPLLSGTCLRSMRLRNVELEGNHDFMGMRAAQRPAAKMAVPHDTFGGSSPEQRAAASLTTMFTFVALRVVLSQLGPGGEGGDLPPTPDYMWLRHFLEENPLRNGNEWLAEMMAQDHRGQMLGLRILEVREAFCEEDFDWQLCRQLTAQQVKDANLALLRQHAARSFGSALGAAEDGDAAGGSEQPGS
ncbi:hypothetical protein C2E21_8117 [Chlorella sorokiniana]|uniref:Uncharacterized protein n=1 Tax=Chlorella sorokiniana TaxID=3076 RepID=A0A2P6TFZ0_CHLSO|nr:hypothetical protein C2E21_8117 [Chlorella sorokiniana]|eukprot:PRW33033.1 hypothetical protein C2E21_8117 [Chlorella sorokiniana]